MHECQYKDCGKSFPAIRDLKRHLMVHTGEKPFECSYCKHQSSRLDNIRKHLQTHVGIDCEIICTDGFVMNDRSRKGSGGRRLRGERSYIKLERRKKSERSKTKSPDLPEEQVQDTPSTPSEEAKYHHDVPNGHFQNDINCNIPLPHTPIRHHHMPQEYYTPPAQHMPMHETAPFMPIVEQVAPFPDKPFRCLRCDKSFASNRALKIHIAKHPTMTYFKCEHCSKEFSHKGALTSHMETHRLLELYSCDQCHQQFTRQSLLQNHLQVHEEERMKPYECEMCDKRYAKPGYLKSHMLTTHAESTTSSPNSSPGSNTNMYDCESCGKQFSDYGLLAAHTKTHTGETPHKCDQCGKRFTLRDSLERHVSAVHTPSKNLFSTPKTRNATPSKTPNSTSNKTPNNTPIKTPNSQVLSEKQDSKENVKIITKNKAAAGKYKCTKCEKSFTESALLRAHLRTHSQKKPLETKLNGKNTKTAAKKKNTVKSEETSVPAQTMESLFECKKCGKLFSLNSYLLLHRRIMHPAGEK